MPQREDWSSILYAIVVISFIIIGVGGVIYVGVTNTSGQGKVISSTPYDAQTIQDGSTYNLIGYNITYTYHGQIASTTLLCGGLYPVGSEIPAQFDNGWWGWGGGSITTGNLPTGCTAGFQW